jgi:hypothetical protein
MQVNCLINIIRRRNHTVSVTTTWTARGHDRVPRCPERARAAPATGSATPAARRAAVGRRLLARRHVRPGQARRRRPPPVFAFIVVTVCRVHHARRGVGGRSRGAVAAGVNGTSAGCVILHEFT